MLRNDNTPVRSRIIQEAAYAAADMPDFAFQIPQPFLPEHFTEAAEATGCAAAGLANQVNQVLAENLGNNMAARVKKAVKNKTDLPTQADMDQLYASYDFTGIRAGGVAFGSLYEKILFRIAGAFIRKLLKKKGYQDQPAPVTVAKKGVEAGDGQIDYDTFESEVVRLMEGDGPWGEAQAFIDLRESLVEEARAEETRVRASEQETESKLAELSLED